MQVRSGWVELGYILPYILRHPQAEAEGMTLVRKCLLMEFLKLSDWASNADGS